MLMQTVALQDLRVLYRPIWAALSSRQSHLSQLAGRARALFANISQFAATDPDVPHDCSGLVTLAAVGKTIAFMHADRLPAVKGARFLDSLPGVQMIPSGPLSHLSEGQIERRGSTDMPTILSLIARSQPEPFKRRTLRMGPYFGVKVNGA